MDYITQIISWISQAASGIVLPLWSLLLFYDARRRKEYAEARGAEADNITQYAAEWKELYEKRDAACAVKGTKIDWLYQEKASDRQRIRDLQEKNAALALENQALRFRECKVRGCARREPPSEY